MAAAATGTRCLRLQSSFSMLNDCLPLLQIGQAVADLLCDESFRRRNGRHLQTVSLQHRGAVSYTSKAELRAPALLSAFAPS
jgi:hypothetical protein